MGRIYSLVYEGTITNAGGDTDWFTILPAANKPIRLRGLKISQYSEVGDAQEEEVQFQLLRLPATVTNGSGGSAASAGNTDPTMNPIDEGDAAPGFTARFNDTTLATSSGTITRLESFGWNERITPFETWWFEDKYAPRVQNAAALALRQKNTIADDMSVQITVYVEEF